MLWFFLKTSENEVSEKYQVRPHKEYGLIVSFLEPFMIYGEKKKI